MDSIGAAPISPPSTTHNSPDDSKKKESAPCSPVEGKSVGEPMTPSPKPRATTIESVDESPTTSIKVKKRSPHADPDDTDPHDRRIFTTKSYTGVKELFQTSPSNKSDASPKAKSPTAESGPKSDAAPKIKSPTTVKYPKSVTAETKREAKILSPPTIPNAHKDTDITFKIHDSCFDTSYDKTNFKSTLPVPLDSTFTIPTSETRSSLMLSTLDLLARYDNHFHRTEYSNSLLRQAREDAERKIEELDWKVRCFAEEEMIHRKDMGILGMKFRDAQGRLVKKDKEIKELVEVAKKRRSEGVDKLEAELERAKSEILVLQKENLDLVDLKERLDDKFEDISMSGAFFQGLSKDQISKLNCRIEELEEKIKDEKELLSRVEDDNSNLQDKLEGLEADLSALQKEHRECSRILEEVHDYREDNARYIAQLEKFNNSEDDATLKIQIDSQEDEINKYLQQINDADTKVEGLQADIESRDEEIGKCNEQIDEARDELARCLDELTKSQKELNKCQEEVEESREEITRLTDKVTKGYEQVEKVRDLEADLTSQVEYHHQELAKINKQLTQAREKEDGLNSKIASQQKELKLMSDLVGPSKSEALLKDRIRVLEAANAKLSSDNEELEIENEAFTRKAQELSMISPRSVLREHDHNNTHRIPISF
ncbi:uncharacterized protein LY89DRAFT_787762 [Mollisia scopiformis]|uniref:Uncharacterized protein n=1 Tax=Mollisia scopiformis TaxID=149040 RepID=A0A132BDR0_MOLSC|nr:uncharacterized protein LY89DRAFT_787762 [Mollisia scopiformis]KUJ10129.1 hypothetical protein LY89DRAFT_787762 [Mollisia scopiformis]